MKKAITLLLAVVVCLSLCACGKSEAVKNVETLIDTIGEVTLDSEATIAAAEEAYAALTAEEKEKVENYDLLTDARAVFDPIKEEYLARQKYVGEWVSIQTAYTVSFSLTLMEDGTYASDHYSWSSKEDADLPKEWTPLGNGIKLGERELIYDDTGAVPKLISYTGNGTCNDFDIVTVFVKKEHAAYSEYLITMDNWQEYFTLEIKLYPQNNTFGDFDYISVTPVLELKEEYIDRVMFTNYDDGVSVEIDGEFYTAYCDIDLETFEITSAELIPYPGQLPITTKSGTVWQSALFYQYQEESYLPGYKHLGYNNSFGLGGIGYQKDGVWVLEPYCPDPVICRIKGSIFLYDYPVHP